jgi:hypothetical protein
MNADDIEDLWQLLAAHRQILAILLKQVAKHGEAYAQPAQISGIAEARAEIVRLKRALRAEGVAVADAPSDEEPASQVFIRLHDLKDGQVFPELDELTDLMGGGQQESRQATGYATNLTSVGH